MILHRCGLIGVTDRSTLRHFLERTICMGQPDCVEALIAPCALDRKR